MNNIKQSAEKKINEIKSVIKKNKYNCSPIIEAQYHFSFEVNNNKSKLKVLIYFGKKGVKVVLQGNQDEKIYSEINDLIFEQGNLFPNSSIELDEPAAYIGTDESGKGDFFGPLVVAGVYVDEKIKRSLINLQVRDSKDLSEGQISYLSKRIQEIIIDNYEIIVLTPEKYNKEYTSHKNLNHMLSDIHEKVIINLLKKVECSNVIIDKFSKLEIDVPKGINVKYIHKAEKYSAVAAASILARDEFNKWFTSKEKEGYNLLKGASEDVEQSAKIFLKNHGVKELNKLVKMHFKTYKKVTSN